MTELLIIIGFILNNIFWMAFIYLFVPGKKKQFSKEKIDIAQLLELNKKKAEKNGEDELENFVKLEGIPLKDIEQSFRNAAKSANQKEEKKN